MLDIPEAEWVIFKPVREYLTGKPQPTILRFQDAASDADLKLLIEHDMKSHKDVPYIFFLENMA